jgi:hypothetical protein
MNLWQKVDRQVAEDISYFWSRVIEGFDYRAKLSNTFNDSDKAIQWNTEYFGPNVTMDDRLRYIASHLSDNQNISDKNRVLNFLITHFYGGRDCHRVINAELDYKLAYTDFERALVDPEYVEQIRSNLDRAKSLGYSIWSRTELHTSLMGASNKYAKENFDFDSHAVNMIIWLAGWIKDGTVDKILSCSSLKECCEILLSKEGIGPYYGYHGATDQSTNPNLNFHHDEPYVIPGPGCQATLKMLFPTLTNRECSPGEQVVWVRENQEELFGKIKFDPYWHNIEVNGSNIYSFQQTELTCYTGEVALCQYGVYCDMKKNPSRIPKRVISTTDVTSIIETLQHPPVSLEDFMN